jgi:hypothetical protein
MAALGKSARFALRRDATALETRRCRGRGHEEQERFRGFKSGLPTLFKKGKKVLKKLVARRLEHGAGLAERTIWGFD